MINSITTSCRRSAASAVVRRCSSTILQNRHRGSSTATANAISASASASRFYSSVNSMKIAERVERVLAAKQKARMSYDELATSLGVTNTYTAQLLMGQAKLTTNTASRLQQALPEISDTDLQAMQTEFPMRTFDEEILKEPNVYRTYEALMHNGEAIKTIINEQCGDGIMSAIDFYCDVGTSTGKHGEKRVVITLNGKFLPYAEQLSEDNGAKSPRD